MDEAPLIENHDVDTAALIHGADEDALPILLPLPVLPYVPDGSVLAVEANQQGVCRTFKLNHSLSKNNHAQSTFST